MKKHLKNPKDKTQPEEDFEKSSPWKFEREFIFECIQFVLNSKEKIIEKFNLQFKVSLILD
jgi:hypothetical protein